MSEEILLSNPCASRSCAPPLVRVVITSFNHEQFIEQAIRSVACQAADFPFEIYIIDDKSTDGTVALVQNLIKDLTIPTYLRILPENRNDNAAFADAINESRAPFLAMLDGDDYWLPGKLQAQLRFFQEHGDCVLLDHGVEYVDTVGTHLSFVSCDGLNHRWAERQLWEFCAVHTAAVMIRREAFSLLPDWYAYSVFGDWELTLIMAQHGCVIREGTARAAYRQHAGGQWTGLAPDKQMAQQLEFYDLVADKFGPSQQAWAIAQRRRLLLNAAKDSFRREAWREGGAWLLKYFAAHSLRSNFR